MTEEVYRENKRGTALFRIDEACYKVSRWSSDNSQCKHPQDDRALSSLLSQLVSRDKMLDIPCEM
jgi:hypothetical protein